MRLPHFLIAPAALLPAWAAAQLSVVTPSPLLADCARQIGGNEVEVSLIPSRDAHSFSPTSAQLQQMANADLILLSGKGLEAAWLPDLRDSIEDDSRIFLVGDTVPNLQAEFPHDHASHDHASHDHASHDHASHDHAGHDHAGADPHWWQSSTCWSTAATWLADELAAQDPAHEAQFLGRAEEFSQKLEALRDEFAPRFATLPAEKRLLVVPHAAFAYLCEDFNLRQLPLLGLGGGGELAARHLEETAAQIRTTSPQALFAETGAPRRAIDQLAATTGVPVAGELLADGDEKPDLTVLEFLRHNLETIAAGLGAAAAPPAGSNSTPAPAARPNADPDAPSQLAGDQSTAPIDPAR